MTNDCLVTKLKGIVNNDALRKLDEIEIYAGSGTKSADGSGAISIYAAGDTVVDVYNVSGNFTNGGVDVKTAEVTVAGSGSVLFKNFDTIRFKPENVVYFSCRSNLADNPLYLSYFKHLNELFLISSNGRHKPAASFGEILDVYAGPNISTMILEDYDLSEWNFSDFATRFGEDEVKKWIGSIIIQNTGININIADLAYFGNVNNINLYRTHAYGSIESYVQLARQKWPSKNSMTFDYGNQEDTQIEITFNGQTVDHSTFESHTLSWTYNTITFDGVTINA